MTVYVNTKGEIKSVDTEVEGLTALDLVDDGNFDGWSVAKICCYRIGVIPEVLTHVVDTITETYTDENGNEQTTTREITESEETGKYIVTMLTPYIDSRLVEQYDRLGNSITEVSETVSEDEEITDAILSTILPSQNDSISDIEDVIDNLFTEILPDLLG